MVTVMDPQSRTLNESTRWPALAGLFLFDLVMGYVAILPVLFTLSGLQHLVWLGFGRPDNDDDAGVALVFGVLVLVPLVLVFYFVNRRGRGGFGGQPRTFWSLSVLGTFLPFLVITLAWKISTVFHVQLWSLYDPLFS